MAPIRVRPSLAAQCVQRQNRLFRLSVLLMAEHEDDDELLQALYVYKLGLDATRSLREGPRGPYDAVKSLDIVAVLRDSSSDRVFQSWFRYVDSSIPSFLLTTH